MAVGELVELIEVDAVSAPTNLLRILGEQLSEGIGDVSFQFEE